MNPSDLTPVHDAHDAPIPTSRPANSRHVDWLEQNLGRTLSDTHARCIHTLGSALGSLYNLPTAGRIIGPALELRDDGSVSLLYTGHIHSYDESTMTRLVIEAHRNGVHTTVAAWDPDETESDDMERDRLARAAYFGYSPADGRFPVLEIRLTCRNTREGGVIVKHPTMWQALTANITPQS